MTETPAGWYLDPEDPSRQRYFDGAAWTEHRTDPAPSPASSPAPAPATAPPLAAAPKQKHTVRNVVLILIGVFVLLLGGCFVVVGLTVNNAVNDVVAGINAPGGPISPLEIQVGQAFEVQGFNYQAGWSVKKDALGDATIEDLKVQNNRDRTDGAIVEIKFLQGSEVVALVDCTTSQITPGQTVTADCFSGDKFPNSYDTVTINDTF